MDKMEWWRATPPMLRGANIFQRWEGDLWCSAFGRGFLQQLQYEGANYVNWSVPGTYNVVPAASPQPAYAEILYATERLQQLVQWADDLSLSSVISFRTGPGRSQTDLVREDGVPIVRDLFTSVAAQDAFVQMWQTVATRYRGHPRIAAYDILVEPHKAEDLADPLANHGAFLLRWREIAARVVQAIRTVDQDTPIIVGLTEYSAFGDLATWPPLIPHDESNTNRIVYGIHQYAPHSYTHAETGAQFDPSFTGLHEAFAFVDAWRARYPRQKVAFAVNEFGVAATLPDARTFLREELNLLHGWRPNGTRQPGLSYAAWLWENAGGACYSGLMNLSADPELLHILRTLGWRRQTP